MRNQAIKRLVSLCVLALCAMVALPACADIVAYDVPLQTGNQGYTGSLGLDFDVTSAIWVTGVGVFDPFAVTGQPLIGPLSVVIFDRNTETQVAGTFYTFPEGTTGPLIGANLFAFLNPYVYLPVGSYSVVAWGYSAQQPNGNVDCNGGICDIDSPDPITSTENDGGGFIAFRSSRFGAVGSVETFPSIFRSSRQTNPFLAGTFSYIPASNEIVNLDGPNTDAPIDPVPEPSTIALLAPAVLGLARKLKRS